MPELIISISKDKNSRENTFLNHENRAFKNLNITSAADNEPGKISFANEFEMILILNDARLSKKLRSGSKNARKMKGEFIVARRIL